MAPGGMAPARSGGAKKMRTIHRVIECCRAWWRSAVSALLRPKHVTLYRRSADGEVVGAILLRDGRTQRR